MSLPLLHSLANPDSSDSLYSKWLADPGWQAGGEERDGHATLAADVPGKGPVQVRVRGWQVAFSEHLREDGADADPLAAFPGHRPDISLTGRTPATIKPSGTGDEAGQTLPTEDASIGKIIELGSRIPIDGATSDYRSRDLGDAVHAIFAAGILRPGSVTEAQAAAILDRFRLSGIVAPADVLSSLRAYLKALDSHFGVSIPLPTSNFQLQTSRIELPFTYLNPEGQRLTGFIDHLLDTPDGPVIIDHKTFPADDDTARTERALSYASQLAAYWEALPSNQRDNVRTFIHFPVTGRLVEVMLS